MEKLIDFFNEYALPVLFVLLAYEVTEKFFQVRYLDFARIFLLSSALILIALFIIKKIKLTLPPLKYSWVFILLLVIFVVNVAVYPSIKGFQEIVRLVFHLSLVLFLWNLFNERYVLAKVWTWGIVSSAVLSSFGIFQYLTGFYLWHGALDSVLRRVNATFWDPNMFGTFLAFSIIFGIFFFSRANLWKQRLIILLILVLEPLVLLLTYSRGAVISLFLGLVLTGL